MAKSITHISVFLASPSDLQEERAAVKQVIEELNSLVRQTMNVHLDLLMWETHAFPSAGVDAQDIINKQIGDDYDIFIGIMWKKFGTPTGRAGSGTEEEFQRAYNKFVEDSGQTKIMMYFSAKPTQLDDIDLEQLNKVRQFKSRAQELGILHWSFNDADSFQQMLKIHLINHIAEVKNQSVVPVVSTKGVVSDSVNVGESVSSGEEGYLDLMEVFSENFSQIEKILSKMASHIEDLGEQMTRKAAKIDTVNKSPNRSPHSYRALIDSSAADINNYVKLTSVELPQFRDLFAIGIDSFSSALAIIETTGNGMDNIELEELIDVIEGAKDNVVQATVGINSFKSSASNWPPVAKTINQAAKSLQLILGEVIEEFNNSVILLDELKHGVTAILDRRGDGESGAEEIMI